MGFNDLTGQVFGNWTALKIDYTTGHRTYWKARCQCGVVRSLRADSLTGGGTGRCNGCQGEALRRKVTSHGMTGSPEYVSWTAAKRRCESVNSSDYQQYGGRGIKLCDRWHSFEAFYEDMGDKPTRRHSLDRIDVNGDYEPGNCRWATPKQQNRNRRNTIRLTANGKTQSLTAWAEELGWARVTLQKRYEAGWPDDLIVNTPKRPPTAPKKWRYAAQPTLLLGSPSPARP